MKQMFGSSQFYIFPAPNVACDQLSRVPSSWLALEKYLTGEQISPPDLQARRLQTYEARTNCEYSCSVVVFPLNRLGVLSLRHPVQETLSIWNSEPVTPILRHSTLVIFLQQSA
jgi:hypothetical protein